MLLESDIMDRLVGDNRLHASHVSLFFALLIVQGRQGMANPFVVSRELLMELSKVGSTRTYHRCIRDMVAYGYIQYVPTYNSFLGTKVYLRAPRQL